MIITSVVLLAAAVALLVIGAVQGNATLLGVSLGAAAAGALALFAGNASARRLALARGVPPEAVLAGRLRRSIARPAEATPPPEPPASPPIDGYEDMSAREVTRLVGSGVMADQDLSAMLVYEASHRRRRAVLTALIDVVGPQRARTTSPSGSDPAPAPRPAARRAEEHAEPT